MSKRMKIKHLGMAILFINPVANAAVELELDGDLVQAHSAIYDFGNRVIDVDPSGAFVCNGPQASIGNGLLLRVNGQTYRLETARFTRAGGVTRIIATTPGELATCGPEGLIFQDYFQ